MDDVRDEAKDGSKRVYWFLAKRYGWGWGMPGTWQGWVVMITWLAVVMLSAPFIAAWNMPVFIAFMVVMSAGLIGVCYAKGEPPRWRWGK